MNIAIVGAGLIGNKRANAIGNNDKIIFICDTDEKNGKALANRCGSQFTTNYRNLLGDKNIQAVIVSTINSSLMPITISMLNNKKHVKKH